MDIISVIAEELNISVSRINAAVKLLDEGDTVAFIARYRKEVTGALTDEDLRELEKKLIYYRSLEEKRQTVLKSMEEQGVLTEELKNQIENVRKLFELEDIYRPFRPKKKTRASIAIAKGLKPVAEVMLKQELEDNFNDYLATFINKEKGVETIADVIKGAEDIVAEAISDDPNYRGFVKRFILNNAFITSKEIAKDEKDTFAMYKDFRESLKKIPNFRILAINRGESLKCLKVDFDFEDDFIKENLQSRIISKKLYSEYLVPTIDDSLKRLSYPSIETEIRNELFERAEDASIKIFEGNLRQLLMYPPLKNKVVLGFDPGFRTGCKVAVVNQTGDLQAVDVVNVTASSQNEIDNGVKTLLFLIKKYNVEYIALGNGTASRESETILSKMIKDNNLSVKISIVNESGASVYSASELGQEEFPKLPVEKRSAISLARRLQDPLSELVKIDPKAIGVGQYQHDMDKTKLDFALSRIVEECVNKVGVNVNTASVSLLKYVSGISDSLAKNIVDYKIKNGEFKDRKTLLKVTKMGPKAFEQSAGFLRIKDGLNPLDNTGVHPESYDIAIKLLGFVGFSTSDVNKKETQDKISALYDNGFFKKCAIEYNDTIDDILKELIKPGHDARDDAEVVELDSTVKDIKDLKVGQILTGVVHNITDFGAFVDINVHQDGLVHISEIADKYIHHPSEVLTINQVVKVKVINVDVDRKKIGLSIKQVSNK